MTFEEFFKKKRIDLAALETGEPALFSEFKTHFEQMGEKSFDHTKKYWFNKTRRQFPLAPEVKTDKPHIANPLAEQTVTESLAETVTPAPPTKMGFLPKFRSGNMPKPAEPLKDEKEGVLNNPVEESPAPPTSKLGFVPKFRVGSIPKPVVAVENKKEETVNNPIEEAPLIEKPAEEATPKPAYKPRFNMKNIPPKPPEES